MGPMEMKPNQELRDKLNELKSKKKITYSGFAEIMNVGSYFSGALNESEISKPTKKELIDACDALIEGKEAEEISRDAYFEIKTMCRRYARVMQRNYRSSLKYAGTNGMPIVPEHADEELNLFDMAEKQSKRNEYIFFEGGDAWAPAIINVNDIICATQSKDGKCTRLSLRGVESTFYISVNEDTESVYKKINKARGIS